MRVRYATLKSPVGPIAVAWNDGKVLLVHMQEATARRDWESEYAPSKPLERLRADLAERFGEVTLEREEGGRPVRALRRYFAGDLRAIDAVDVDMDGTPFQRRVWRELRRIPVGRTLTYGQIAKSAGSPGAARAAGGAVGSNPVPIIVPCHRVVASDRKLTGFGGGLVRKQWLLEHEGAVRTVRSRPGSRTPAPRR